MEFALSIKATKVPRWLASNTTQLGLHHGRVHLNCVCNASSAVRIHMRNAARVPRLTLRFLNADNREERTVVVDASNDDTFWSHDRVAVPFVDRPLGDEPADVVVTITNPAHALPVYEHGGNVAPADFKRSWRDSASPYALVDIGNTIFLVPPTDKELVTADAFDLIRLRDHYESIYRHYENTIMVFDSPTAADADRVYARQFFCKVDAGSGAGIAFYSRDWIGASTNTLQRYLNVDADPWLILHEIGHGHEFAFVDTAPPLIEVWTNILPNLFQFDTMTAAERETAAWIYDFGRREAVERGLGALIDRRVDYDKFSFRERLFAYAPLTQTSAGKRAFQRMHLQLRRFNIRGDGPTEYLIADWWSHVAEVDCLPLFMLMQQKIVSCCRYGRDVRPVYTFERALSAFKRVPYPACRLLSDFDTRSNNYGMPGLETTFAPIYPGQSNASIAELTIVMHIDEPAQIDGELVELFDGSRLVCAAVVDGTRARFGPRVPVGVYGLHVPRGRDRRYDITIPENRFNDKGNVCTNLYAIVTNATASVDVLYELKDEPSVIARLAGYLMGYSDRLAAGFVVDVAKRRVELTVYRSQPHWFFVRYFTIAVHRNDALVGELVALGNHNNADYYQSVEYQPNDVMTLTLFDNATRDRLIFMGVALQQLQTRYLLSSSGVQDLSDRSEPASAERQIRTKLSEVTDFLDSEPSLLYIENWLKDDILLMIKALPDSQTLMRTHCRYLPKHFKCLESAPYAPWWSVLSLVAVGVVCLLLLFFAIATIARRGPRAKRDVVGP
ncbi:VEF-2 [Olene mendosa nucleopolyhedrovirus]|uniref:VEF-2 n=1 Tax=Olene mendosa nucleopolyhedrovirus TaxID=2933796 RepID=A0AAX3AWB1_9ABAC|nr:VEF-2 [Olene mendosa nucleopolyhedrovirus]UOQ18927.1 VEF-2 [Olene mendosa nucleopolyhedrovirus]